MKKLAALLVSLIISTSFASTLYAKKYNMVFWYPGEQGTTAEAEPVLASFFNYLNGKLKGNTFSGKYFNSTQSGRAYIRNSKPQFGIVSWIALQENHSTLPQTGLIAQTKPMPDGATADQFTLVGYAEPGKEWQPAGNALIYSSIPISIALLKSRMMPDFNQSYALQTTNTMLLTLKKIASGENPNHVALLTPMEKHTLDNIKTDWKKNLTTIYTCKAVPTAQLIYFGEEPEVTKDLVKILTAMPGDPKGNEILETLRLKGFKPAS